MTMTADFTCGMCRAALVDVASQAGGAPAVRLGAGVRLHFEANGFCVAVCGDCGAVTALPLAKVLRFQLQHVQQQQAQQQQ